MWKHIKHFIQRGFHRIYEQKPNCGRIVKTGSKPDVRNVCLLHTKILPSLFTINQTVQRRLCPFYWQQKYYKDNYKKQSETCGNETEKHAEHTFLEAVGWGTALVLGWQVCQPLCRRRRRNFDEDERRHISKCESLASLLARVVWAQPITAASIFPQEEASIQTLFNQHDSRDKVPLNVDEVCYEDGPSYGPITGEQALDNAAKIFQDVKDSVIGDIENRLGVESMKMNKPSKAYQYFEEAFKLGNVKATFNLAICHELGVGTQQDLKKATEYYADASKRGHATAMYNLGVYYAQGRGGLPPSEETAQKLFRKAAELGQPDAKQALAQYKTSSETEHSDLKYEEEASDLYLGMCNENGWGVKEDPEMAAEYYSKAALKGNTDAMYNLASNYERGIPEAPKDPYFTMELLKMASDEGHVQASSKLSEMEAYEAVGRLDEVFQSSNSGSLHQSFSFPTMARVKNSLSSSYSVSLSSLESSHETEYLDTWSENGKPIFYVGD